MTGPFTGTERCEGYHRGCPAPKHAHPGQPVELGVCIGHGMEPGDRWGRLVAIRWQETGKAKFVLRLYQPGDGAFPTGKYVTTWLLVPHTQASEETR